MKTMGSHILIVTLLLLAPASAMAYIDPGTGSMMLQVILGGLAAVGVALKLYWHKILRALGLGSKREVEVKSQAEAHSEDQAT
jgi:hypothetical protein